MDRFWSLLMFILISCLISGCNLAGVSSNVSQQASGNEDQVIAPKDLEKVTVSYGQGQVGINMGVPYVREQTIVTAPFAEDRFAYRPTRTGGMPTILYPKGVPYSENTPLLARE